MSSTRAETESSARTLLFGQVHRLLLGRWIRRQWLGVVLAALAVGLGIGLQVGMRSVGRSTSIAVERALAGLVGKSDMSVVADRLDRTQVRRVDELPEVRATLRSRVVRTTAVHEGRRSDIELRGVVVGREAIARQHRLRAFDGDLRQLSKESDRVAVARGLAKILDLEVGDELTLLRRSPGPERRVEIAAVFDGAGLLRAVDDTLIVADLTRVEEWFGDGEASDRLDLLLEPGADPETLRRALVGIAGAEARIRDSRAGLDEATRALDLFRRTWDLIGGACLGFALVVVSLAAGARYRARERTFALTRDLGIRPFDKLVLTTFEPLLIGLVGGGLGGLLGQGVVTHHREAILSLANWFAPSRLGAAEREAQVPVVELSLFEPMVLGVALALLGTALPALVWPWLDRSLREGATRRSFALLPALAITAAFLAWVGCGARFHLGRLGSGMRLLNALAAVFALVWAAQVFVIGGASLLRRLAPRLGAPRVLAGSLATSRGPIRIRVRAVALGLCLGVGVLFVGLRTSFVSAVEQAEQQASAFVCEPLPEDFDPSGWLSEPGVLRLVRDVGNPESIRVACASGADLEPLVAKVREDLGSGVSILRLDRVGAEFRSVGQAAIELLGTATWIVALLLLAIVIALPRALAVEGPEAGPHRERLLTIEGALLGALAGLSGVAVAEWTRYCWSIWTVPDVLGLTLPWQPIPWIGAAAVVLGVALGILLQRERLRPS